MVMERNTEGSSSDAIMGSAILPVQFNDLRRGGDGAIAPLKRLMMAVLEDALRCFQNNADAKSSGGKRLFVEAEQWLNSQDDDGLFSFDTVCETLGINPEFLRRGLREWREQQLAGISSRRLTRRSPVVRIHRVTSR